jgi:hypothetical protein
MAKDVVNVVGLEAVIDADLDTARGSNAVDGIEEGGCIGCKDTNSGDVVLAEVVG